MTCWKWAKKNETEKERLACWKLELEVEEGGCGAVEVDEEEGN